MDPYLEGHWLDVHHRLITYACDQLQPRLPAELRARVEERVFLEAEGREYRSLYPDVHVIERRRVQEEARKPVDNIAVAEPIVIQVADEPVTQGYIEIVDATSGHRVVTVIEFLSPSNKVPGPGQDLYLKKQQEVRAAAANLVEIDLTRAGTRALALPAGRIPPSHRTTYQVCVWRSSKPLAFEVYRVPLKERLPVIRIPLRESDADVPLDLQALIDQCYLNGRYDDLNYKGAPDPPLDADEASWAEELLRSKGQR
jgi:hypothetical protein